MSWLYTLTKKTAAHFLPFLAACGLLFAAPLQAQNLETAIMPGKTIQGHADLEVACNNCHVRFDKAAQPKLCLDCHKPVAADVRTHTGYHGRLKNTECRSCHTDHKGRDAKIVLLEERKFDHTQTDFALKGKHRGKTCVSCQKAGAKHRAAPSECNACHRNDDKHKGGLGPKCENCHGEDTWKDGKFDHGKTKFPLLQAHAKVKCADCHVDQKYNDTARECVACHRRDDPHKGNYGNRCENCHAESQWKTLIFRHEKDTKFPLLDKHRLVKCESCHKAPVYREKTPTRCVACHRSDDTHKGALGDKCEKCHTERNWKGSRFDHDKDTQFPLREKHKAAQCQACHKDPTMREKLPLKCFACHEADDQKKGHRGALGDKCDKCHNEKAFKPSTFNHDKDTEFPLAGKHRKIKCEACHKEPLYRAKTETRCITCHEKDDIHFGSYDLRCERCHVPDDWRKIIKKEGEPAPGAAPR